MTDETRSAITPYDSSQDMVDDTEVDMSPVLLAKAAMLMYGKNWQIPTARLTGVDGRTVRRWHASEYPTPDSAIPVMIRALQDHIVKIEQMIRTLEIAGETGVLPQRPLPRMRPGPAKKKAAGKRKKA